MASARLLNLLALTVLATLFTTLGSQPVQALEQRSVQFGRRAHHNQIADNQLLKKRSNSKKCRARPSTGNPAPTSTDKGSSQPAPTKGNDPQPQPTETHSSGGGSKPPPPPPPPPSPPSSPSNGGLFRNKFGLAWAQPNDQLNNYPGAGWMFNWQSSEPPQARKLGIDYCPQLWGWKNLDDFKKDTKNSNYKCYFGPNEPNEPGQANLSVDEGISIWRQAMTPLKKQGKRLMSPVTSSNPNGLKWVHDFKNKCGSDCDWDITNIHWYDTTAEKFKKYCEDWHNAFGKDIIISEFALQNFNGGSQPTSGQVWAFFAEVIPWLEAQDWIVGYAVYGYMRPLNINGNMELLGGDNKPNSLGKWIINAAGL